ncbi:hypothetical protein [Hymenobacter sp. DG01]|uniref:hypothetical protein n=1 Tax=Hymenobacter sp. DG01 TaxID=2584940 RepID=UPI0011245858|nr:hypothetical protein [Hymenobacter sp. DG01]
MPHDDDFLPENFSFDDHEDLEYLKHRALFEKAKELAHLTQAFVQSLPEPPEIPLLGEMMLENSYVLGAKLAASRAVPYYSRRMELAVLIKVAAEGLLTQTSTCHMLSIGAPEYWQLLRDEVEQFRLLFVAWVQDFDPTTDVEDEWGLFSNPLR